MYENIDFRSITHLLDYISFRLRNNCTVSQDDKIVKICIFKNDLAKRWNQSLEILRYLVKQDDKKFNISFTYEKSENLCQLEFRELEDSKDFQDSIYTFLLQGLCGVIKEKGLHEDFFNSNITKYQQPNLYANAEDDFKSNALVWLDYKNDILTLNTQWESRKVCECNSGSLNDNLLTFLFENPDKVWTRRELDEENILITNTEQSRDKKRNKEFL